MTATTAARRVRVVPTWTRTGILLALGLGAWLAGSSPLHAADQTWDGGSLIDGNWSTGANWLGDLVPGSTSVLNSSDVATFTTAMANGWGTSLTPIVIDSAAQNIRGISFAGQAGSYVIGATSGNALLVSSGGTIQMLSTLAVASTATVNAPLVVQGASGTYALTNNSGLGTLVFGGGITGGVAGTTALTLSGTNLNANMVSGIIANGSATSLTVTKSGAGTWVLSGANTYTGTTTISGGVLEIQHAGALGSISGNTSVSSGAALQMSGGITTLAEPLTLRGEGISTTGALRNISGDNTYAGLLTLGSATRIQSDAGTLTLGNTGTITGNFALTVGGAGNTTIHSSIGTGTLTKDGTGTLTLSAASTYMGRTTVNGGTLVLAFGTVSSNIVSDSSPLTLGGGTLRFTGSGTLTQTFAGLTTMASTLSSIVVAGSQTLTLGALTQAGAGSALSFNTA
ncbi:MAG: autotransporter-associated beta strand repeat-containing protein, partial [Prosthecobacter sp.]